MKKAFTIIALFISILVNGQVSENRSSSKAIYKSIPGLTIIDSLLFEDIAGEFSISSGLGGYHFRLGSNMKFQKIDFSCMASFNVDSGSWTIKNHNIVVLKSNKRTLYFDIVKFDNFYFFIQPSQRLKFIADLKATRIKFKDFKPITIDEKIISAKTMIGMSLGENYYSKEIDDITNEASNEFPAFANTRKLAVIVRTMPTKSKADNLTESKLKNYARTASLQSDG